LYQNVYIQIYNRIQTGIYPRASVLPSESKLGEEFGVSLITIRRAIHELALDGLIESRQGMGNFVRDPVGDSAVVRMSSFTSDVAAGRLRVVRTLMDDSMVPAPVDVAEKLGVQTGSMVRYLVRLDYEAGEPLSIDMVFIPAVAAKEITQEMAGSPLFMHLWQEAAGIDLVRTEYEIGTEMSTEHDQATLGIGPDVPVLVTWELIHDSAGRRAAWIINRYRGDRSRLSATVTLVQIETEHGTIGE
ncbi:MAG TPA: GntR family transcriptional regulator, partial [Armatimonadota bacterium]